MDVVLAVAAWLVAVLMLYDGARGALTGRARQMRRNAPLDRVLFGVGHLGLALALVALGVVFVDADAMSSPVMVAVGVVAALGLVCLVVQVLRDMNAPHRVQRFR